MLSTRLDMLLTEIDADNTEIAVLSHCSPSNISRLKSGKRSPSKATPTIIAVAEGICIFCEEQDLTKKLVELIGSKADKRETLSKDIVSWLFSTEPDETAFHVTSEEEKAAFFASKLTTVMQLAEISNSKLSHDVNIDASYISRFKSGKRKPKTSSKLLLNICTVLTARLSEYGKLDKLADLMEEDPAVFTRDNAANKLKKWLLSTDPSQSLDAVEKLLESLRELPAIFKKKLPAFSDIITDDILNDDSIYYDGNEGLKSATMRFLSTAALDGDDHTLYFYSDRSIEWFKGDFSEKWLSAMKKCCDNGARVIIVHSYERTPSELAFAVKEWIQLYSLGNVESYFCTRPRGSKFKHTLFLDKGKKFVVNCEPAVADYGSRFFYLTEKPWLDEGERAFGAMTCECSPYILPFDKSLRRDKNTKVYRYEEIDILIGTDLVAVENTKDKRVAFSFRNPHICSAIKAYVEKKCQRVDNKARK